METAHRMRHSPAGMDQRSPLKTTGSAPGRKAVTPTRASCSASPPGTSRRISAGPWTSLLRSSTTWFASSGCSETILPPAMPLGYIHSSKIQTSRLRFRASSTATPKSRHHVGPKIVRVGARLPDEAGIAALGHFANHLADGLGRLALRPEQRHQRGLGVRHPRTGKRKNGRKTAHRMSGSDRVSQVSRFYRSCVQARILGAIWTGPSEPS